MRNIIWSMFFCTLILGCLKEPTPPQYTNPIDPENPEFVFPRADIIEGPAEGSAVTEDNVSFQWQGNNEKVVDYRYQFRGIWSPWTEETRAAFDYLEEGTYTFSVIGRYPTKVTSVDTTVRHFTVQPDWGTSLRISPRYIRVPPGTKFTLDVVANEVTDLMLAHIVIDFEASVLDSVEVAKGDFLQRDTGRIVLLQRGGQKVDLSIGVAIGDPRGVDGTGTIAHITFRATHEGETVLSLDASEIRDHENVPITLDATWNAKVVIE